MVLVNNVEVRTDDTHACLHDLLKIAKCSVRSSNYKAILRQVKRNHTETKLVNRELWVTFDFASKVFMGFECSKLINNLAKASADLGYRLARPARRSESESQRLVQEELERSASPQTLQEADDGDPDSVQQAKKRKVIHSPPAPEPVPVLSPPQRGFEDLPGDEEPQTIDLTDDDMYHEPEVEPASDLDSSIQLSFHDASDLVSLNPTDSDVWLQCLVIWPDYHSQKRLHGARVNADPQFLSEFIKFEYKHNNYTAAIDLLEALTKRTPNDPAMWLFIVDICLAHGIMGQSSLIEQGLKYMANAKYCRERTPFILKAADYFRIKDKSPFTTLALVSQIMRRVDNWTTSEINTLHKLVRCLFELAQSLYEPYYPSELNSIEMLPELERPSEAQRLIAKYMEKSETAGISTEKWLFYMNILDGLMDKYFLKPPSLNSVEETWSDYLTVWLNYVHALRRQQIDPNRIFGLFEQIYKQIPQFTRDKAVVDYSQILFDAGHVNDALGLLSKWVETGKEYTRGFRKEVLRFHFCILIDACRIKDRFDALIPYLVRFRNDGQIWESIIRFEYHTGDPSIARSIAELALKVLKGSSRECIWTCYLKCDKGLSTEMYENILARYFQEFKTTESINLLSEFYKETQGEAIGENILAKGIQYQRELGQYLAVDEYMGLL